MKRVFLNFCLSLTAASMLLAGGCKSRNEQGCNGRCSTQRDEQAGSKGYMSEKFDLDLQFVNTFYPSQEKLAADFAGRTFLSKKCSRISPVENGKTTVYLPVGDNGVCKSDPTAPPSKPVPAGTRFPGLDSIGRVELKVTSLDQTQKDFLWATAFKVGEQTRDGKKYDLIATTCHALQPVIKLDSTGKWILKPPYDDETLWLDLGERTDYGGSQYRIRKLIAYGQTAGLDVALLEVDHFPSDSLRFLPPDTVTSAIELNPTWPLTVVGYVDLFHPVDPFFDLSYGRFVSSGDDKFVSLGRFSSARRPASPEFNELSYLFHDAATSMGQSGSPVFRGDDFSPTGVLGVHVCCTAYWQDEKANPPTDYKMIPCGRVTRSAYNKAVSSRDILKDPQLCQTLYDYGNPYKCSR